MLTKIHTKITIVVVENREPYYFTGHFQQHMSLAAQISDRLNRFISIMQYPTFLHSSTI